MSILPVQPSFGAEYKPAVKSRTEALEAPKNRTEAKPQRNWTGWIIGASLAAAAIGAVVVKKKFFPPQEPKLYDDVFLPYNKLRENCSDTLTALKNGQSALEKAEKELAEETQKGCSSERAEQLKEQVLGLKNNAAKLQESADEAKQARLAYMLKEKKRILMKQAQKRHEVLHPEDAEKKAKEYLETNRRFIYDKLKKNTEETAALRGVLKGKGYAEEEINKAAYGYKSWKDMLKNYTAGSKFKPAKEGLQTEIQNISVNDGNVMQIAERTDTPATLNGVSTALGVSEKSSAQGIVAHAQPTNYYVKNGDDYYRLDDLSIREYIGKPLMYLADESTNNFIEIDCYNPDIPLKLKH